MHRHRYEVIRRVPNTKHPFVKRCTICSRTLRYHRGRWVVTDPGKP